MARYDPARVVAAKPSAEPGSCCPRERWRLLQAARVGSGGWSNIRRCRRPDHLHDGQWADGQRM